LWLLLLPPSAVAKLYLYKDDDGKTRYTRYPEKVLPQYKKSLKLVRQDIEIKHSAAAVVAEILSPTTRKNWIICNAHDYAVGVRIGSVLVHCSVESLLALGLLLETVLLLWMLWRILKIRKRPDFRRSWWSYFRPVLVFALPLFLILVFWFCRLTGISSRPARTIWRLFTRPRFRTTAPAASSISGMDNWRMSDINGMCHNNVYVPRFRTIKGVLTMKIIKTLLMAVFLVLLPGAALSALYKYVDDNGVTNFTDSFRKIPEKYRSRAVLVEKEIQSESPQGGAEQALKKLTGQTEVSWQDFIAKDKDGNPAGLNPRALFMKSLVESKLLYWLLGELAFTVVMLAAFAAFFNWPTALGRKLYPGSIAAIWLVCSALLTIFFIRPATREFLAISRGYLDEVIRKAPLDQQGKKVITDLDDKLAEFQSKLH